MDFFERWFHFSPDGGDGTMEAAYLAGLIGLAAATVVYAVLRRLRGRSLPSHDAGSAVG